MPSSFTLTRLFALLKKGKDPTDPESIRPIAIESVMLKIMTMIFYLRFEQWMSDEELHSRFQNAFRAGRRSEDHAFTFLAALMKCKAEGKSLFVAFLDLENAFPNVDRASLWLMMYEKGAGGRWFDWARKMYSGMKYRLKKGDEMGPIFGSETGILIGDSASPGFWIFYISDLDFQKDEDDILMAAMYLAHMLQADDLILLSLSVAGLQSRLDTLARYAARKFMLINADKTKIFLAGRKPNILPTFRFNDTALQYCTRYQYIGIWFSTENRLSFLNLHYENCARKALKASFSLFSIETHLGCLRPWDLLLKYKCLVDPHLTSGCTILVNNVKRYSVIKSNVQFACYRRMLRVGKRTCRAAILLILQEQDIDVRCLILAAKNWRYIVKTEEERPVHQALIESYEQDRASNASQWSSMREALSTYNIVLPPPDQLTERWLDNSVSTIKKEARVQLISEVNNNQKLPLLHDFPELAGRFPPLDVRITTHRISLIRFLLGQHRLKCETERFHRYDRDIFRIEKACCSTCFQATGAFVIENEEHLFTCDTQPELIALRADLEKSTHPRGNTDPIDYAKELLFDKTTVASFARFIHSALKLVEARMSAKEKQQILGSAQRDIDEAESMDQVEEREAEGFLGLGESESEDESEDEENESADEDIVGSETDSEGCDEADETREG